MNSYVDFVIKPNLPVIGKQYGKLIPKIKNEIAKLNQMELANNIKKGVNVEVCIEDVVIGLNQENLLVTMEGREGFAFSSEGEIGVVLDTHISLELQKEGFVREILSKVQNMRKDKGFEVLDKIELYVAKNEVLEEVIKENEELIKHDTLSEKIIYNEDKEGYTEENINGEMLKLDVKKI